MKIERGIYKRGQTYWVRYSFRGREYRESCGSNKITHARKLLKKRIAECESGKLIGPTQDRVILGDLAEDYLRDYEINARKSTRAAKARTQHLLEYFGYLKRVVDISPSKLKEYTHHRLQEQAANATINRELTALGRMFRLAVESEKLTMIPHIPRLEEPPAREGFFEHEEYLSVRRHLPPDLQDVLDFGYNSGWRSGEILSLRWSDLDFDGGMIRLRAAESKNKERRVLPLSEPLRQVLERRWEGRRPMCPFVFHRNGKQIKDYASAWKRACETAGLEGKLFHDLRRTVARNLIRSGVPRSTARRITGHKTESVFERYNITVEEDLREAAEKLAGYLEKRQSRRKVVPFKRKIAEA